MTREIHHKLQQISTLAGQQTFVNREKLKNSQKIVKMIPTDTTPARCTDVDIGLPLDPTKVRRNFKKIS